MLAGKCLPCAWMCRNGWGNNAKWGITECFIKISVSVDYKKLHTRYIDLMIFIPVALYSESNVENQKKKMQYVITLISRSVKFPWIRGLLFLKPGHGNYHRLDTVSEVKSHCQPCSRIQFKSTVELVRTSI